MLYVIRVSMAATDAQIDPRVYVLYGLTDGEIQIVAENTLL
jgi:hypothetical protein